MKYSAESVNELTQIGFKLGYTYQDHEIFYQVFHNGYFQITICHTDQKITFDIDTRQKGLTLPPFKIFKQLVEQINQYKHTPASQ